MVCPTGPAPHPWPTPTCDRCSRQERQGATSGVLALRTAASMTAHSILRPPTPCQLGGPSRAAFTRPGSASRTQMRERVLLPAPTQHGAGRDPIPSRAPRGWRGSGPSGVPDQLPLRRDHCHFHDPSAEDTRGPAPWAVGRPGHWPSPAPYWPTVMISSFPSGVGDDTRINMRSPFPQEKESVWARSRRCGSQTRFSQTAATGHMELWSP